MALEDPHLVVAHQLALWCLCFFLLASTQHAERCKSKRPPIEKLNWFGFEQSLDDELFQNAHRMGKASFCALCSMMLANSKKKYDRHHSVRLSYHWMLSITLSFLGGARTCDLSVLHRPIRKSVMFSCIWNVIGATNETFQFEFPEDAES